MDCAAEAEGGVDPVNPAISQIILSGVESRMFNRGENYMLEAFPSPSCFLQ